MPACLCMSYGLVYPAGGQTDVMDSYVVTYCRDCTDGPSDY